MNTPTPDEDYAGALSVENLEELDAMIERMRERGHEDIPVWEFFDGFLAALVCMRRSATPYEYLPLMLGGDWVGDAPEGEDLPLLDVFADAAEQARFMQLLLLRKDEVQQQLDADVQALDEDQAYAPATVDLRGALALLPEQEREQVVTGGPLAYFAQVWALGFMFAVSCWPEEWEAPRDKDAASWLQDALESIDALTEDDTGTPSVSMLSDDAPPSVSRERVEAFGEAIWAVYDLRQLWKSLGPRQAPLHKAHTPGRNEPCWCGSGKKFKKCHGA